MGSKQTNLRLSTVYIAGPFFSESQRKVIECIESLLDTYEIDYYSPRHEGVLLDLSVEERAKHLKRIFESNVSNIDGCDIMIAVTDGRDTGTIFEMGYFTCKSTNSTSETLITFSNENYGLNVMLQQAADAHIQGMEDLTSLICDAQDNEGVLSSQILEKYTKFNEDIH